MKVLKTKNQFMVQLKKTILFHWYKHNNYGNNKTFKFKLFTSFLLLTDFRLKTKKNNFLSIFLTKKTNWYL